MQNTFPHRTQALQTLIEHVHILSIDDNCQVLFTQRLVYTSEYLLVEELYNASAVSEYQCNMMNYTGYDIGVQVGQIE